jgi:hypothetical protein
MATTQYPIELTRLRPLNLNPQQETSWNRNSPNVWAAL